MTSILLIETATQYCHVSLAIDSVVIAEKSSNEQNIHAKVLHRYIQHVLEEASISMQTLDAVAVSKGPGSYTGLRIGVSTAKGLCYSLNIPLISTPTLYSIASGTLMETRDKNALYCPMIDARRMEVYTALYDSGLAEIEKTKAQVVEEHSYSTLLEKHRIYFSGSGASKVRDIISHPHASFIENIHPSGLAVASLAQQKFDEKKFEDVAYFEPFYLKDFIAAKPVVKGLK